MQAWVFESHADRSAISPYDHTTFWLSTYITPVVWGFLAVAAIFRFNFQWLLIVVIAIVLSMANMLGYLRCAKGEGIRARPALARTDCDRLLVG